MSNSSLRTLTWLPFIIFICGHLSIYCMIGSWPTPPRSDWLEGSIWIRCEDQAWLQLCWASFTVLARGWNQAQWHLFEPWSYWVREKTSHPQGDDETNGWKCHAEMHSIAEATATLAVLIPYGSSQGHWPAVINKTTSHNDSAQMTTDQRYSLTSLSWDWYYELLLD